MDVLLTGAGGRVGTALRRELDDVALALTDRREVPDAETHVADMRDYEEFRAAFEGRDAVVHLAHDTDLHWQVTEVAWTPVLLDNLRGTVNAFRAAVEAGVDTLVFASTIHVVGAIEREGAPGIYEPDRPPVADHTDAAPDSMYAVVKLFGEALARFCADEHGLRCYCLRLGAVHAVGEDHPYAGPERAVTAEDLERGSAAYERRVAKAKAHWCSHRDLADLVRRCLSADEPAFDVFYAVSDNARRWVDIDHAREAVGYAPRDDAEEWSGPP
ncbi:MAG: NAD-dependent epimerase/dehydratase family protein [Halobacteriales archaeon]